MGFDIVIPTLNLDRACKAVNCLKAMAEYKHQYFIIDNGDDPQGYVKPCNAGFFAGDQDYVFFINDDVRVYTRGWDKKFVNLINTYEASDEPAIICPRVPGEEHMALNGWFLGLNREFAEGYGYAFDQRFVIWCGDIDLMRRARQEGQQVAWVDGLDIQHVYSETTSQKDIQDWIIPLELRDLELYKLKWSTEANVDKCLQEN